MKFLFVLFFVFPFVASAEVLECLRVRVLPSAICENLKATLDDSQCDQKYNLRSQRIECKNEFFAELVFESDSTLYRSVLTKNANGTWSAGQVVSEPLIKPISTPTVVAKPLEPSKLDYWANFRIRAENDKESNLTNSRSPTHMRVRPGVEWKNSSRLSLMVEAQAIKLFGAEEYRGTSATANSRTKTSGQGYDQSISLHQGVLKYQFNDELSVRLGRTSMNYGEGLLVGFGDWSEYGRSFDGGVLRGQHPWGWAEVFTAKIVDRSVTADQPGNEDLSGGYFHFDFGSGLSNVDPYVFNYQDSTNVDASGNATLSRMYEIWSYGLRLKSELGLFDYRVEATTQTGAISGQQVEGELGYSMSSLRVSTEYFDANEEFNQLFASPHGQFGNADIFARKNIQGHRVGLDYRFTEELTFLTNYYWLFRHSQTKDMSLISGTGVGTASTAKDVGQEWDIEVAYRPEQNLQILLGYADFFAGSYIKDQYSRIDPVKWYLELTAKF